MTLDDVCSAAIGPALALLPAAMDSPRARIMLLATGLQESRFIHRRQIGGPARGFWQFEQGGGVFGAMRHQASRSYLEQLCARRVVPFEARFIWGALEHDDVLAAGLARLLYWTDGKPLPSIGDASAAWDLYYRTWRPGKPHRQTWDAFYTEAVGFVVGGGA